MTPHVVFVVLAALTLAATIYAATSHWILAGVVLALGTLVTCWFARRA